MSGNKDDDMLYADHIRAIPPSAVHYVTASAATPAVTATPVLDVESCVPEVQEHSRPQPAYQYSYASENNTRHWGNSNNPEGNSVRDARAVSNLNYESSATAAENSNRESYLPTFVMPSPDHLMRVILSGLVNCGIYAVLIYYFFVIVIYDDNMKLKPFKTSCFEFEEMTDNICLFSAGQISYGLISFGQVNVGLFCIGQVNLGLLFAFGQVAASIGFAPVGQVCTGWYIHFCQLGFAMYRIKGAQVGFQFLKSIFPGPSDTPGEVCVATCG